MKQLLSIFALLISLRAVAEVTIVEGKVSPLTGVSSASVTAAIADEAAARIAADALKMSKTGDTMTGQLLMSGSSITLSGSALIKMSTSAANPTHVEGRVFYDSTDKTLSYYNDEADITLNVGQEIWVRVRNNTGSTILEGKAIYISGATGNRPTIALAKGDTDTTSQVAGVTTHDIENNTEGYITTVGLVHNLNTSAFNEGDILHLSTMTAGGFSTEHLIGPGFDVVVGVVARSHVNQGVIAVNIYPHISVGIGAADQVRAMNSSGGAEAFKTLAGTTNQVLVSHSGTAITLSAPQNLHAGASVNFAAGNFSGAVAASSYTGNGAGLTNLTAANIAAGTAGISVTGNAATVTTNANLTGPVTSVGNATTIVGPIPAAAVDLSTVTTALAAKVNKAGDTMTGRLTAPDYTATYGVSAATANFATGPVGIGTTSPARQLDVVAATPGYISRFGDGTQKIVLFTGAGYGSLGVESAGHDLRLWTDDDASSGLILKATSRNVGIGTTSPSEKLHVSGNILSNSSVTASAFFGDGSNLTGISAGENAFFAAAKTFGSSVTVQGNAFSVGASSLVVAGGRVGIGTTAPDYQFHVHGSSGWIRQTSDNASLFFGKSAESPSSPGTTPYLLMMEGYGSGLAGNIEQRMARGSRASPTATQSGDSVQYAARGYEGASFSTATFASINMVANQNQASGSNGSRITFNTTANTTVGKVERMRITHDGDVLISTTSQSGKLFVYQPDSASSRIGLRVHQNSTVSGTLGIRVDMPTSTNNKTDGLGGLDIRGYSPYMSLRDKDNVTKWDFQIDDDNNDKLIIGNAGSSAIVINNVGVFDDRVGIGTNVPAARLDVNGGIITSSSMTAAGLVTVGGGTNIVYWCSGSTSGTFDGNLARGNGNAGACSGGTWVATSLRVD